MRRGSEYYRKFKNETPPPFSLKKETPSLPVPWRKGRGGAQNITGIQILPLPPTPKKKLPLLPLRTIGEGLRRGSEYDRYSKMRTPAPVLLKKDSSLSLIVPWGKFAVGLRILQEFKNKIPRPPPPQKMTLPFPSSYHGGKFAAGLRLLQKFKNKTPPPYT